MKAVVMFQYGALPSIDDTEEFYRDIFHGRIPSPEILEAGRQLYRGLGTCDPLYSISRRQAAALERRLSAAFQEEVKVYIGHYHTSPYIQDAIDALMRDGANEILLLPLTLLYSKSGVGNYLRIAHEALASYPMRPPVWEVTGWALHPELTKLIASRLEDAHRFLPRKVQPETTVVFTAHSKPGLPSAHTEYIKQFLAMAEAVAFEAGITRWRTAYRSGGPKSQRWLGPDVLEVITEEKKQGRQAIVTCDLLSVTENSEVLRDIGTSCQQLAHQLGMEFVRTGFLNDSDDFMTLLADIIQQKKASLR